MDRLIARRPLLRRSFAFSPFVLLVILTLFLILFYGFMERSRDEVARNREARLAAEEVISDLTDMETAQRGYLLIGQHSYLAPYREGSLALKEDTLQLRRNMIKSALQNTRYRRVQQQIGTRVSLLDSTITLYMAGDFAAARDVVRDGRGKVHMDSIRALIRAMDATEQARLDSQIGREQFAGTLLVFGFGIGIVLVGLVGFFTNRAMLRQAHRQEQSLEEIAQQNALLQNQQVEMEAQRSELESQNEELFTLNEELTEATQRAEQANEAKTTFLMSMSHELRTPLNAIAGYTDLIEAGVYGPVPDKIRDAAARIHVNQQQLLSIINQILDYTGLRAETHSVSLYDFDVVPVVQSLDAIVAPLVAEKALRYHAELPADEPLVVRAHPERLRQVLINLIGNAIKFTPAPGDIVVRCAAQNGFVRISVAETGVGIEPRLMQRIFEPFVQGVSGHTRAATAGVGLGLAISRELMRSMGGEITVSSTPASGSTFTLALPAVSALPAPPAFAANLL